MRVDRTIGETSKRACELFLSDHELGDVCADAGHRAALARRGAGAESWSVIERGEDGGGRRDFLDGKPISCGSTLELQAIAHHDDDYGGYTLKLPTGALVRYELGGVTAADGRRAIELYASIAGHRVVFPHDDGMRFRWPERS